ncbi:glycine cleavage system aminomethyltransferase GcvT [Rubellimicrobium sp. CFH 75288]|uniref:glycine cleavage system aminomethyltransferase GcvT n=1 Tax=Rubellimicrobium sp. CFH 75288 TaxID=2697034 RepID=UPI001411FDB6|nr:glycine cleavage system aminomethyltransferase GcvT [Rubellimicrobium sp. CFH 75288]NAZ36074.1 glycine cleavage system aminomethyltransferase GcvT [Rubellimicrobium sp. CFH 75288]
MGDNADRPLRRLPLHALHAARGARMAEFAGWSMPIRYEEGVMAEHLHTRAAASLFDVSHMAQILLRSGRGVARAALALEACTPADLVGLPEGRQRYALLTDDAGGIRDDVMVSHLGDALLVVANAANREAVLAHLRDALPAVTVEEIADRALLALQGPRSEEVLSSLLPEVAAMRFMDAARLRWAGGEIWVSRSGYSGEDGFEISVPAALAERLAEALLDQGGVKPAGLGARDSLRLEAGLCLHGQDIDRTTTPVEAGLAWSIGRARRIGGERAGGFPGADRILTELEVGPRRRRVGLRPEGRQPMRAGTEVMGPDGRVGLVTSGGFSPSLAAPISMAYVDARWAEPGTRLAGEVRGRPLAAEVVALPFLPPSFKR